MPLTPQEARLLFIKAVRPRGRGLLERDRQILYDIYIQIQSLEYRFQTTKNRIPAEVTHWWRALRHGG